MKISKVNHTRAAVSVNQRRAKGILYPYPLQKKKGKPVRPPVSEFDDHFDEINKNAKLLYGILSPEKKGKRYGRVPEELRSKTNQFIKKLVQFNDENAGKVIEKQMEFINGKLEDIDQYIFRYTDDFIVSYSLPEWDMDRYIIRYTVEPNITALVNAYLRKSLRKNTVIENTSTVRKCYLPTVAEKLIRALCAPDSTTTTERMEMYHKAIASINEDELRTFLMSLNNDYTRSSQKKLVKKSIENQNVKANVILKDGLYLLQPSYAGHKKRQAIFDFMLRYADGGDEERTELLSYMRGLIVLYICGEDAYKDLQESGIVLKDFTAPFISSDLVFCADASDIFREEEPKALKKRLREVYEYELVRHYKQALAFFEKEAERNLSSAMSEDKRKDAIKTAVRKEAFWLDFIEQEVKVAINLSKPDKEYKNNALYLCRKVWKRWTAFMAEKYIDLGKAVYHFAIPVMPSDKNAPVKVGIVRQQYRNGLTSFDYEHIKAVENMERSVSIAVTFAVNNFSRSALKCPSGKTTDILFLKENQMEGSLYPDAGRRILRYFGGASQWKNNDVVKNSIMGRGDELYFEIRKQLESLRNGSYHYTQKFDDTVSSIVPAMLESEKEWLGPIIRKKYYSNNTHWFYPVQKLDILMRSLYRTPAARGDQVPAFARLYNQDKLYNEEKIFSPKTRAEIECLGNEKADIFRGAAFFLFKEIYYYDFLKDHSIAQTFRNLVFSRDVPCDNLGALKNFRNRIKDIRYGASMGEIAQTIMTDYNLQNQQKETSEITASEETKEEKYKSFPMILYRYMRLTFLDFLEKNKEKYGFLFAPEEQVAQLQITEEVFCDGKEEPANMMFRDLSFKLGGKKSVAPWYVLGHMISPTHLNHLSGSLRSYIRYLKDIDARAYQTDNQNPAMYKANQQEAAYFKRVLEVLEFCRFFCGRTSKEVADYYADGQYAGEIFKYVDAEQHLGRAEGISDAQVLASFCSQKTGYKKTDGTPETIGLYHDGTNEILNRNIVLASLYGTDRIIRNAADKVTEKDIRDYYQLKHAISREDMSGEKKDAAKHIRKIKELQSRKNHVELVNVKIYSDILNDLMTQLVSWAYFRERDQMYLELGAQYLRIFFGGHIGRDSILRQLSWKDIVNIREGAVLHQIVAMYTYHRPLYQITYDGAGTGITGVKERVGMYSAKEEHFKKYCGSQDIFKPELYFFEVEKEHDIIKDIRNYIDHFGYFVNADRSILDLYSDIYNMFFNYSENYKKSVTFILPNILSKYFVLTGVHLNKEVREVINSNNARVMRNFAAIGTDRELKSSQLTYNVEGVVSDNGHLGKDVQLNKNRSGSAGKTKNNSITPKKKTVPVKVDARDTQFLKDLKQILYYRYC